MYFTPLHDLPVQRLTRHSRNFHHVLDILPAVVVVDRVGPQDWLVFVLESKVVQVLSTSRKSISTRLPVVSGHLNAALVAPQDIIDRFSIAIATSSRTAGKAFLATTIFFWPWIWPSQLLFQSNPTLLNDLESYPSPLVVLGFFHSHSLCQLAPWRVRDKQGNFVAPSSKPILLLGILFLLPFSFFLLCFS